LCRGAEESPEILGLNNVGGNFLFYALDDKFFLLRSCLKVKINVSKFIKRTEFKGGVLTISLRSKITCNRNVMQPAAPR